MELSGTCGVVEDTESYAKTTVNHLELATDLSVDVFIRRDSQLEDYLGQRQSNFFSYTRVKKFLISKRIDWRFNVDRAPWWGSFFERLIQNTKRCLRKTLRNSKLTYDELHTFLVEVEELLTLDP